MQENISIGIDDLFMRFDHLLLQDYIVISMLELWCEMSDQMVDDGVAPM